MYSLYVQVPVWDSNTWQLFSFILGIIPLNHIETPLFFTDGTKSSITNVSHAVSVATIISTPSTLIVQFVIAPLITLTVYTAFACAVPNL